MNLEEKAKVESAAYTVQALRSIVQPHGKRGMWLQKLSDKRLAEVYHRLKLGQPSYHIAKVARDEWGVMKGSDIKVMARTIRNFRNRVIGSIKVEEQVAPKSNPERKKEVAAFKARAKKISEDIDGMEVLAKLVKTQSDRLDAIVAKEKLSLPFKFTDKVVEVLLASVDKLLFYQIKLGLLEVKTPEINLILKQRFDGVMGKIISSDSSRLLAATDKMLSRAEELYVELEEGSDGIFRKEQPAGDDAQGEIHSS